MNILKLHDPNAGTMNLGAKKNIFKQTNENVYI